MSRIPKLRWLCRRGMKELDLLLLHYLEHSYPLADPTEQKVFESLLELPDPDLYALLTGSVETKDPLQIRVLSVLRNGLQPPDRVRSQE